MSEEKKENKSEEANSDKEGKKFVLTEDMPSGVSHGEFEYPKETLKSTKSKGNNDSSECDCGPDCECKNKES